MSSEKTSYPSLVKLQQVCLNQHIPFASYRLPDKPEIITLVQHQSYPEKIDVLNQPDQKSGFIMAPFFETTTHATYLLEPDDVFLSDHIGEDYIRELSLHAGLLFSDEPTAKSIVTTTREDFIQQVNDARKAIAGGKFHKVVLSKVRNETIPSDFDASAFFIHLCDTYPHAFVSLVQLPQVGCWIGATPEPLLVVEEGLIKTVSLAGTQLATGNKIESYKWSNKELEEQGIVTGFVEETLHTLGINQLKVQGPENYQAANLIHLKTSFEFNEDELENKFGACLQALHPTPSVGGLPKEAARQFILTKEKHDRAYYTGFLGPLNIQNKSHLFVNLRCLQLFNKQFVLYSGAGITAASIAENEWEETENKMMTMMNAMKNP